MPCETLGIEVQERSTIHAPYPQNFARPVGMDFFDLRKRLQ